MIEGFELDPAWPRMSLAEVDAALTAPGARFEMEEVDDPRRRRRGCGRTRRPRCRCSPASRASTASGCSPSTRTSGSASRPSFRATAALAAELAAARRRQGRPGRARHGQPARMAGRLLRDHRAGRDRGAAQRLVDRRRARIWPRRFGREGADLRPRPLASGSRRTAPRLPGARACHRQPRASRRRGRDAARGPDRPADGLEGPARRRPARRRRSIPTTRRRSSTPAAPPASPRARSAPTAT